MNGTVIDVQVFTREGVKKDARALEIEKAEFDKIKKDLTMNCVFVKMHFISVLKNCYWIKRLQGGPAGLKAGQKLLKLICRKLPREKWFDIHLKDEATAATFRSC